MWVALGVTGAFCFLIGLAISLARKEGSKSAQLDSQLAQIRKEAQEAKRAKKIVDSVRSMSDDDVASRLQDISSK